MTTSYLGEFEQMILLAIVHLGENAYGMAIVRDLNERGHRSVSRGALYLTLDRMVKKGYLTSELGEAEPVRGGRAKRYFTLTPRGLETLRHSGRALLSMWEGHEALLNDV